MTRKRTERDTMGEVEIPAEAYYGASTARAVENFPVSERRMPKRMIRSLGWIKWAAAGVNRELGRLDAGLAGAIESAALEVADGKLDGEFVVDLYQTGSGTSTNMNANEVIANRAAEILGGARGDRSLVHPNDHVNLGQSSNDVIPTALHLAVRLAIREALEPGLEALHRGLEDRSRAFWDVIKTGRTHLQDATPVRLGQVFRGYADQVRRGRSRVERASEELEEVALGGTAVGTGINTHPQFSARVCEAVSLQCGVTIRETDEHFQAQSALDAVVFASGCVRTVAVSLHKIANDIRWLGSGPRTGLGEIELPAVQPGSSIMPGKVNPVLCESVIQVCAQVCANDLAVLQAGLGGFFELNTMLPLAAGNLVESVEILGAVAEAFDRKCVRGLEATDRGPETVAQGLGLATGLVPAVGYDLAAGIAKEAAASGRTVREVARERTDLDGEALDRALDPFRMTAPSE